MTQKNTNKLRQFASLSGNDLFALLICSVRYSLGRRSYIVGWICQLVKANAKYLEKAQIETILKDINEHEESYAKMHKKDDPKQAFGMQCDYEEWMNLKQFLISYKDE